MLFNFWYLFVLTIIINNIFIAYSKFIYNHSYDINATVISSISFV